MNEYTDNKEEVIICDLSNTLISNYKGQKLVNDAVDVILAALYQHGYEIYITTNADKSQYNLVKQALDKEDIKYDHIITKERSKIDLFNEIKDNKYVKFAIVFDNESEKELNALKIQTLRTSGVL